MRTTARAALVAVICLITSACGQDRLAGANFNSATNTVNNAVNTVKIDQLKMTVQNAQTSMQGAQSTLGTIFNTSTGAFNWGIFLNGVNFSNLGASTQACLKAAFPTKDPATLVLTAPTDVAAAMTCVFNDVITVAGIAKADLNVALTTLTNTLATLPPGSPEAAAIEQLITEVQTLQAQYSMLFQQLAQQLNVVTQFLQTLPTLAAGAIPNPLLGLLTGMTIQQYVQPIVAAIQKFQTELQAI